MFLLFNYRNLDTPDRQRCRYFQADQACPDDHNLIEPSLLQPLTNYPGILGMPELHNISKAVTRQFGLYWACSRRNDQLIVRQNCFFTGICIGYKNNLFLPVNSGSQRLRQYPDILDALKKVGIAERSCWCFH